MGSIHERLGLTPVINAAGTLTGLGASTNSPRVIAAMNEAMGSFLSMLELQRAASERIASHTGAEAGFVTHCAAAGVIASIAACMTGSDFAKIEQLPDTDGLRNEVVIQLGHVVHYGGRITQNIAQTGAKPITVGDATRSGRYQLAGAITEHTAAALFVVSHHTVDYGQIELRSFVEVCAQRGVPVIVDAASEYAFRSFVDSGADIVVFSGHKFLAGPTSGIVAGRRDLVRAALCQERGICRAMKPSKEAVVGALEALDQWAERDAEAIRRRELELIQRIEHQISGARGLTVTRDDDPTGNPITRLRVTVDEDTLGVTAFGMLTAIGRGDPPIALRALEIDHGYFHIDPCQIDEQQADAVAKAIIGFCNEPYSPAGLVENEADSEIAAYRNWP